MVAKKTASVETGNPPTLPPGFSIRREPGGKARIAHGPSGKTLVVATGSVDDVAAALAAFMPRDQAVAATPDTQPVASPKPEAAAKQSPAKQAPPPPPAATKLRAKASSDIEPLPLGPEGRPDGWPDNVKGAGYEMRYRLDPETKQPGYAVFSGRNEVASVRYEGPVKIVIRHESGAKSTVHRNVDGVRSRLDAVYRG